MRAHIFRPHRRRVGAVPGRPRVPGAAAVAPDSAGSGHASGLQQPQAAGGGLCCCALHLLSLVP